MLSLSNTFQEGQSPAFWKLEINNAVHKVAKSAIKGFLIIGSNILLCYLNVKIFLTFKVYLHSFGD